MSHTRNVSIKYPCRVRSQQIADVHSEGYRDAGGRRRPYKWTVVMNNAGWLGLVSLYADPKTQPPHDPRNHDEQSDRGLRTQAFGADGRMYAAAIELRAEVFPLVPIAAVLRRALDIGLGQIEGGFSMDHSVAWSCIVGAASEGALPPQSEWPGLVAAGVESMRVTRGQRTASPMVCEYLVDFVDDCVSGFVKPGDTIESTHAAYLQWCHAHNGDVMGHALKPMDRTEFTREYAAELAGRSE